MEIRELYGKIEAILFSSGDPVSGERLAQVLNMDEKTLHKLMATHMETFNREESGIWILRLEGGYQMCSNPAYAAEVRESMDLRRNTPLSQAAMEVLAVIAYNQPVTKAFVEQIRGVDCSGVIGSLSSKGLIEEKGRLELPGRPLLYGTTQDFLRCFGISSLDELPPLPEREQKEVPFQADAEEVRETDDEKGEFPNEG